MKGSKVSGRTTVNDLRRPGQVHVVVNGDIDNMNAVIRADRRRRLNSLADALSLSFRSNCVSEETEESECMFSVGATVVA